MRPACLSFHKPLAVLALLAAATGCVSSAVAAPRLKLRCSVTPRTLPSAGGTITVHVDAGSRTVEDLLVTLTRPDRTTDTEAMMPLGGGKFDAAFELPPNAGRKALDYSLKAFARGASSTGASADCGTVRVKAFADAPSFSIVSCRLSPRALPAAGGKVHVRAEITGKLQALQVQAVVFEHKPAVQVNLTASSPGIYRGDLTLPANEGDVPQFFNVHLTARRARSEESVEKDCGFATVAAADTSAQVSGIAVAGALNGFPQIRTFRSDTLAAITSFLPFGRGVEGTATIAGADLDADGVTDLISGAGAGLTPQVVVTSGRDGHEIHSFFAFDPSFLGGVFVAAGDVNGDGVPDVIAGAGEGSTGGHVKVFDGRDGGVISSFLAFAPSYSGGVRVAVGDVNGDGYADIVTGTGEGVAGQVKVFSGANGSVLRSFFAYSAGFTGGIRVATGDVNGDGQADIITGAGGGASGPHVKVFDGKSGDVLRSFLAFDAGFTGGVSVAAADVDGDGKADIITGAGEGDAGGHVKVFSGGNGAEIRSFTAYDAGFTGGVSVAAWK